MYRSQCQICLKAQIHMSRNTKEPKKYLQSEFVEAEVDEVLDAGQDAVVQVLPGDALEDDTEGRGLQVIM